jgi:hypothetical protein
MGIDFYKFNEKNCRLSHIKGFPMQTGHYWHEPKEGVFVLASSPPKLGQMTTFFTRPKASKNFQGSKFTIDVAPSVTDMWTESPIHCRNIPDSHTGAVPCPHSILLAK